MSGDDPQGLKVRISGLEALLVGRSTLDGDARERVAGLLEDLIGAFERSDRAEEAERLRGLGEDAAPAEIRDRLGEIRMMLARPAAPTPPAGLEGLDLDELLEDFLAESRENLAEVESRLAGLSPGRPDGEELAAIFRALHSIKGNASFLSLRVTERTAHLAENLLSRLRDGELELRPDHVDVLLEAVDALAAHLQSLEASRREAEGDFAPLFERLERAREPVSATAGDEDGATGTGFPADPGSGDEGAASAQLSSRPRPSEAVESFDLDELLDDFLVESRDTLGDAEVRLSGLTPERARESDYDSLFRAVHSIKGNASFLGLSRTERLAHATETLLGRLRDGVVALESRHVDLLLESLDVLRSLFRQIETARDEGKVETRELVQALNAAGEPSEGEAPGAEAPLFPRPQGFDEPVESGWETPSPPPPSSASTRRLQISSEERSAFDIDGGSDEAPIAGRRTTKHWDRKVRVDIDLLDRLMNVVGELVLVKNRLAGHVEGASAADSLETTQQGLAQLTDNLRELVLKARMQPLGRLWRRLPRIVREISQKRGKLVRLELEGEDTELDRGVLEAIKDPLTHLVRNAIGHGIEDPRVRKARGKSREGTLTLRARPEAEQVVVEIADDGAGMDLMQLRLQAARRGLMTEDAARSLSDQEALHLIYRPGFSTAARVTKLSGRGVGMDVVKENIEALGGAIELETRLGRGTTFRLKLPLTMAIAPALIVTCGGRRFVLMQSSVQELVTLDGDEVGARVERVQERPFLRWRGRHVPLVYLSEELELDGGRRALPEPGDAARLVIIRVFEKIFALVVDRIVDTREVVVKPLGRHLASLPWYLATTLLEDGKVVLILDVAGLARGLASNESTRSGTDSVDGFQLDEGGSSTIVFRLDESWHAALPAARVMRLEEFAEEQVRRSDDREVVPYRGGLLPLVRLAKFLREVDFKREDAAQPATDGPLRVLVVEQGETSLGLVVQAVIDIVETPLVVTRRQRPGGVYGTAVLDSLAVDLLDLDKLIEATGVVLYEAGAEDGDD